jgi:hypothetical protein
MEASIALGCGGKGLGLRVTSLGGTRQTTPVTNFFCIAFSPPVARDGADIRDGA